MSKVSLRGYLVICVSSDVSSIAGEFHVDLYTLPDSLVQMLWNFSEEKVGS